MAGVIPLPSRVQYLDAAGLPLAGGFVNVYLAGTTTRTNTWQDKAQTTLNENPIELDASGSCAIYVDAALTYKFVITDADGATQPHLGGDNILIGGDSTSVVSGISDEVVTVAGIAGAVSAVAAIDDDVTAAAAIASDITILAPIASDITAAAAIAADITATAGVAGSIPTVAGIAGDIPTVAGISTSIAQTAADSAQIVRLAGYTTEMGLVAAGLGDVATLAAQIETANGTHNATTLLGDYTQGLAIDLTTSQTAVQVKVLDTTTPANDYTGSLLDFMAAAGITFTTPKLCLQEDGSLKYQTHNDLLQSGDPSTTWTATNCTPTTGQTGPDGTTTDATLLTVSGATTTPRIGQNVTVLANMYRRQELVLKAGTAPFVYIEVTNNAVTRRAWFNTSTLAWATVDSGLTTAGPFTTKEDGTAWATGWRSIAAYGKGSGGTTDVVRFGFSDTDGGTTCTVGRTVTVAQTQSHRGVKRLPYIATTTVTRRDIPYDWSDGGRAVRLDLQVAYKGRASDDLTNATYWTPSSITPVLNAVGPHGEPCTTLTATADNGTIAQAVTSSGTTQMGFGWLRRKTGTGTVELSVDNGATWKDITDEIGEAGGDYRQVWLRGTAANPTLVLRMATSGDEVETALMNVATTTTVPPPVPSVAIDVTNSIDVLSIATSVMPSAAAMTAYTDIWMHESSIGSAGARCRVGFFGAGNIKSTADLNAMASTIRLEHTWNDGVTNTDENWGDTGTGRIQIQQRYKAGDCAMAANGNAAWWNAIPGSYTFTSFGFTLVQSIWLRRLLIVPEAISDDNDDLRTFQLDTTDANVNSSLLASAFVAKCVHDSTGILRIPGTAKLYERGDVVGIACFYGQRYTSGYNLEAPQRAMMRRFEFDRSTNELTALDASPRTVYEPATWATGEAGTQGYTPLKITHGPYRGRLVELLMVQGTAGGTPDARSLYVTLSDDNGDTWSAPVKFMDKSVFIGASAGFVATGENSTIFQITDPDDLHFGRIYASLNANNANHYAMWCDDFKTGGDGSGENWSYSTTPVSSTSGGFGTLSEPALVYYPNTSTIGMFLRNTGGGIMGYAESTDYGVTFGTAAEIDGDNASQNVNCGAIQDDRTGQLGLRGRVILARSTAAGRIDHKIQSTKAADMNFAEADNYRLFSPERFIGYCPLLKLFENDNIYACMAEVQPTVSSNVNTSQMLAVFRY